MSKPEPKPTTWYSIQPKGGSLWTLVTEVRRENAKTQRTESEVDSRSAAVGRLISAVARAE